jgi:hypothetical protein
LVRQFVTARGKSSPKLDGIKDPTQRRNWHCLVLFNNPVDRQPVTTLGRQMYPSRRNFLLQTFDKATEKPYGYLLVDLSENA